MDLQAAAPARSSIDAELASAEPLAAIDLGSNSFRLEIGQVQQGLYRRVDYLKETVRLGAGLDANERLTEEAILRGLACLARFEQRLRGFPAANVRAVATQTLREAKNRDAFLARARPVLGLPIEVISGREEARLTFAGVARLQPSDAPRLVVDIGGRSTELILGQGRAARRTESFQVGCVSLSMKYFGSGRYTQATFRAAQIAAGAEMEEALEAFSPAHWQEALGSSGTVGAVSELLAASAVSDGSITPEGLRWCIDKCLQAGHMDRLNLPSLKTDRRQVLAGGLAILYTLTTHFGIDKLNPARGALRQGVIFDLSERLAATKSSPDGHELRDDSVRALQQRFDVDPVQAARVQMLALRLYKAFAPRPPSADFMRELGWAAALHELGMMVSHHDHHRHSAYLLAHVDAAGFSQSQQRRLAALVLGQRGGLRKIENELAEEGFAWQLMSLRLAVLLCHARQTPEVDSMQVQRNGRTASIGYRLDWADQHPRTVFLLDEERLAWERADAPLRIVLPSAA